MMRTEDDALMPRVRWRTAIAVATLIATGAASYTVVQAQVRDLEQQVVQLRNTGTDELKKHEQEQSRETTELKVQMAKIQAELTYIRQTVEHIDRNVQ